MWLRIFGTEPSSQDLLDALLVAARVLDNMVCWVIQDRFHFALGSGWSLALSADSAERIRIEACHRSVPRSSMWTLAHDHARLAAVVERMSNEVREPV